MSPIYVPPRPNNEPVNQRVTSYHTRSEVRAIEAYARSRRLSVSAAVRELVKKALNAP